MQTSVHATRRHTMQKWLIAFIAVCALVQFSCKEQPYASEIRVLKDISDALLAYKAAVKSGTDLGQVTHANVDLLGKLRKLSPQVLTIVTNHPDWEANPPAEVADHVSRYLRVNEEFTKDTLLLANDLVQNNSDNAELSDSFDSLIAFLTPSGSGSGSQTGNSEE